MMIPKSAQRVSQNTSERSNELIRWEAYRSVTYYAAHPDKIDGRLKELDREWDTERILELHSSALSLLGLFFGITRSRKWLLLPLAVQGFFLQHSVQGWCPPLELVRRLGIRTQHEIEAERQALKALRGDFANMPAENNDAGILQAIER